MSMKDHTEGQNSLVAGLVILRRNALIAGAVVTFTLSHQLLAKAFGFEDIFFFSSLLVDMVFWAALGLAAYSTVFFDLSGGRAFKSMLLLRFYWRDLSFVCCGLVPGLIIISIAVGLADQSFWEIVISVLIFSFFMFILFSFFGTWLPAVGRCGRQSSFVSGIRPRRENIRGHLSSACSLGGADHVPGRGLLRIDGRRHHAF